LHLHALAPVPDCRIQLTVKANAAPA
jgi:hypothetical protein